LDKVIAITWIIKYKKIFKKHLFVTITKGEKTRMGDFNKHLKLAKEKLKATVTAYQNKQTAVVGDLGIKVVEQ